MALITLNGVTVLSGTIWLPAVGVTSADLVLDNPDGTGFDSGTDVTLTTADGSFSLTGTIAPNRNGTLLDASHVRVLGGAGGMAQMVTPRYYAQPGALVSDVVNAILNDVGESLSSTSDAGFLGTTLPAWLVIQASASASLQRLIDVVSPGFRWRVLADGTVWVGAESWPSATVSNSDAMRFDPVEGSYDLGVEAPFIAPGMNVTGVNLSGTSNGDVGNVGRVEHHIEGGKIRTIVYQDMPQTERGIAAAIGALVDNAVAHVDLFALYEAQVIKQSGNTVDVQPKDSRLPGMSGVQLRHGLPAVSVTVAPGAFVLVGWDGGDPSKPYAALWGGGETLTALSIGALADAVITKLDLTALINAISAATYVPWPLGVAGTPTPLVFVPPAAYGSTTVKVQR